MHLDGTAAGLWLVGVGSFLVAVPRLFHAARPQLGLDWESMSARVERLRFAAETVGLIMVAIGSVVLAAVELGRLWFVLAIVAAALLGVWLVATTKLRQLWLMRAEQACDYADTSIASAAAMRAVALRNAEWRTCVCAAFAQTPPWPPELDSNVPDLDGATARLRPRQIADLHARDACLERAHIPPRIAHDVDAINRQGWAVEIAGDALIAISPDGRNAQISRSMVADSKVGMLHRQLWLHQLEALGLKMRPGARGQTRPGGSQGDDVGPAG